MISLPLKAFADALAPQPKRDFASWLTTEMTIPEGNRKGLLYDPESRPWTKCLLPLLPRYKQIWLAAVPRAGKSLLAVAYGLWRLSEWGDAIQLLGPDQKTIWEMYLDKVEAAILANPRLAALLPTGYTTKQTPSAYLRFSNGGVMRIVYNPASIHAYDSRVLVCTEASQFALTRDEADTITLAQRRQDDHSGGLQFFESTHTRDSSRFAQEVQRGTNSYLVCPCPHCGEYFEAGEKSTVSGWDVENEGDVDTHVICPVGCRIDEAHRESMQRACKIVHRRPDASVLSLSVNWWHTKTAMQDVGLLEWQLKNNPSLDQMRNLSQNIYCLPVRLEDESAKPTSSKVTKEMLIERRANYESGVIPPQVVSVVSSIDCQKKWLYHCTMGIDANQTVYWLDWGVVEIVPREMQASMDATPEMVLEALESCYQILMARSPKAVWIDTSYKHTASDVPLIRRWAQKYSNVFAVAGRSHTEFAKIDVATALPPSVRDYMQVRPQVDGSSLWFLDVDRLKTALADKMKYPPNSSGGVQFPKDLHEKGRSWLMDHLLNEEPTVITTRQGINTVKWVPAKWARSRNDAWDCSVYAFAGLLLWMAVNPTQILLPTTVAPVKKPVARPQYNRPRPRREVRGF